MYVSRFSLAGRDLGPTAVLGLVGYHNTTARATAQSGVDGFLDPRLTYRNGINFLRAPYYDTEILSVMDTLVHTIEVQQSPTLAHSPYHVPTIGQTLKLDIQEANIYAKLGLAWLTEVEPDSQTPRLERRWVASGHFQSHASIRLRQAYHHRFMCPPRTPIPAVAGPPRTYQDQ